MSETSVETLTQDLKRHLRQAKLMASLERKGELWNYFDDQLEADLINDYCQHYDEIIKTYASNFGGFYINRYIEDWLNSQLTKSAHKLF